MNWLVVRTAGTKKLKFIGAYRLGEKGIIRAVIVAATAINLTGSSKET